MPEFLEAIRTVQPQGRWKVLVVDEHSQKLLGSVLKQFDILEENVTSAYLYVIDEPVLNTLERSDRVDHE